MYILCSFKENVSSTRGQLSAGDAAFQAFASPPSGNKPLPPRLMDGPASGTRAGRMRVMSAEELSGADMLDGAPPAYVAALGRQREERKAKAKGKRKRKAVSRVSCWANVEKYWQGVEDAHPEIFGTCDQRAYDAALLQQQAEEGQGGATLIDDPIEVKRAHREKLRARNKAAKTKRTLSADPARAVEREDRGSCVVLSLRDQAAWRREVAQLGHVK